jgi:hypothetical protein
MTKDKLTKAVDVTILTTKEALQTVVDALNPGQQKQLLKKPGVKEMLDRFGVEY